MANQLSSLVLHSSRRAAPGSGLRRRQRCSDQRSAAVQTEGAEPGTQGCWWQVERAGPQPHSLSGARGAVFQRPHIPALFYPAEPQGGSARLLPAVHALAQGLQSLGPVGTGRLCPPGKAVSLWVHRLFQQLHLRPCPAGRLRQTEGPLSCVQPGVGSCTAGKLCRAPGPEHRRLSSPGEPGGSPSMQGAGAPRHELPASEQP